MKGVKPVHELEILGKPLPPEQAETFLKQFKEQEAGKRREVDAGGWAAGGI